MGKLGYVLKRIKGMDFGRFFRTAGDVHEKCGKPRIAILFDMIVCGFKYQAGYMDYQLFEMYKMNSRERATVITRGINNEIQKKYNKPEFLKYFRDKVLFNRTFDKYLHRDWIYLDGENREEFARFLDGKDEVMIKPSSGSCGQGIEKIKVAEIDVDALYDKLMSEERCLVEEVATQCEEIGKLHPSSINTLRVVTLNKKVVVAFLRIGNKGYVVDNFNHEGLAAPVDIDDGAIKYKAIDKEHHEYEVHPYTGEKIVGLVIPKWNEIKTLCEEASTVVPEIGYAGWDVCLSDDGPLLIEGNEFPGHDIYQLPPHRDGNEGLLPLFKKAMEEEK